MLGIVFQNSRLSSTFPKKKPTDHSGVTIILDLYSHVLPNMQDELARSCGQPSEAVVEISIIEEIGYCVLLYTSLPVGNNSTAGPF